jgi:hypothetical protein
VLLAKAKREHAGTKIDKQVLGLLALLVQKIHILTCRAGDSAEISTDVCTQREGRGTHFTCFTSTKVQTLTQKAL